MAVRRAAMYCVQCTIVLHLRVTNHTVEIRFVFYYGRFPADGSKVSFLKKVMTMI